MNTATPTGSGGKGAIRPLPRYSLTNCTLTTQSLVPCDQSEDDPFESTKLGFGRSVWDSSASIGEAGESHTDRPSPSIRLSSQEHWKSKPIDFRSC
jgi:hypothetical protein